MTITEKDRKSNYKERRILWVEPSHFRMDTALHRMADLEIMRQLAKRNFSTFLVVIKSKKCAQFHVEKSQVRTISIPLKSASVLSTVMYAIVLLFCLPVYIIRLKPDFVVDAPDLSILSFMPTLVFSKLRKVKYILDVRSVPVETFGFKGFLQDLRFAISILVAKRFFDGITILTSPMKKELCNKFDISPDKVGVWTSGVSTELFDPEKYVSEGLELRRKFGLSRKFVVFYHGVFAATRGLQETLEAMRILRPNYPDVVIFLLGTGPIADELQALVKKEMLEGFVIIHSRVDHKDVPKFIEMSDACIVPLPDHPYWRFQCPLKLLEYLAMEKVVITTDIPAHRSIIGGRRCGVYISSIKPTDIAKSIAYVYCNKEKLERWGKSGRSIVSERYTWDKVANDLQTYLSRYEVEALRGS